MNENTNDLLFYPYLKIKFSFQTWVKILQNKHFLVHFAKYYKHCHATQIKLWMHTEFAFWVSFICQTFQVF